MNNYIKRISTLMIGFIVIAFGIVLTIRAGIGLSPWGAVNEGLVNTFGISFGVASMVVGLTIVCITLFFGVYPGIGTILNIIFINC